MLSVPCSASIRRSAASTAGSAVASAITRLSVGPSSIIVATPVTLHLDLSDGHGRRARPDDLAHLRDRVGTEAERRDAGRAVYAEHVGDAELAAHHEHRRIDLAGSPGTGGTTSAIDGTPATIAGTAS